MSSRFQNLLRIWDQYVQKYESKSDQIQTELSEVIKEHLNSGNKMDLQKIMDETGKCAAEIVTG